MNLSYTRRKIFPIPFQEILLPLMCHYSYLTPDIIKLFDIQATKLLLAYLQKTNDTKSFLLNCLSNFDVNLIVPLNPKTYVHYSPWINVTYSLTIDASQHAYSVRSSFRMEREGRKPFVFHFCNLLCLPNEQVLPVPIISPVALPLIFQF